MVKLYDKGVYLLNGTEIVESCEEVAEEKFPEKKQPKKQWLIIFYLNIIHPVIWTDCRLNLIS